MKKQAYNPYLPSYEYIPDGEPHVFGDRIYIFGSHDRFDGDNFCLNDYVAYSASVYDLKNWQYGGVIYKKIQDPKNAGKDENKINYYNNRGGIHAMWAPDVVKGLDGKYYLYYCLDYVPTISVAVCDTPVGKYEYIGMVKHSDGVPLGEKDTDLNQFDPGIFIDDDGEIYLYSGNAPISKEYVNLKQGSQVMKLEKDMLTLKSKPKVLLPDIYSAKGTGFEEHEFFEASSIRKIKNTYYLIYSSVKSRELCYATSCKPDSDFKFGGTIIDIADIGLNGRLENEGINALGNTHGGIECINGKWYIFYHRQTNRTNYSRQGCAEEIEFDDIGRIAQVEVTSCGLNGAPLIANGAYSAYICCQLTGEKGVEFSSLEKMKMDYPYLTQQYFDIEPSSKEALEDDNMPCQYIRNIKSGTTIGYKYFSFLSKLKLKIWLRGNGEGEIKISIKEKDCFIGSMDISVHTEDWCEYEGYLKEIDGIFPLYFSFMGKGCVDLLKFEFIYE